MTPNAFKNINGNTYHYGENGKVYYFSNDGARYTNQFMNKGAKQYYFDDQGIMLTNQDRIIDGKFYHFNVNGEATQVNDPSKIRNTVAKQIAAALNNENVQNIEYDWQNKDQLAIVLFKPGQETFSQKASSPVSFTISTIYPVAGSNVTVKDAIKVNDNLSNTDVKDGVTQFSSELLQGKQGTRISDDVLKAIFAGLAGNEHALDGAKNYYADNGDAYHYEFWLDSVDSNNTRYGEPVTVNYTASLKWAKKDMVASEN